MNSVKLQNTKLIYKNLLHFCTLIMNYQKEKSRKQFHYDHIKNNKIPRNKFNKGGERSAHTENYKTLMKEIEDNTKK